MRPGQQQRRHRRAASCRAAAPGSARSPATGGTGGRCRSRSRWRGRTGRDRPDAGGTRRGRAARRAGAGADAESPHGKRQSEQSALACRPWLSCGAVAAPQRAGLRDEPVERFGVPAGRGVQDRRHVELLLERRVDDAEQRQPVEQIRAVVPGADHRGEVGDARRAADVAEHAARPPASASCSARRRRTCGTTESSTSRSTCCGCAIA